MTMQLLPSEMHLKGFDTAGAAILRALTNMEGAMHRWRQLAERGATDKEIREALDYELGLGGGCYGPGQFDVAYKGGEQPHVTVGRRRPLKGRALVERVRGMFRIQQRGEDPAETPKSPDRQLDLFEASA